MSKKTENPLMQQYNHIKGKHPDVLLLFRVGDFYETYGQDAINAANNLGIVLMHQAEFAPVALAKFPHYALDTNLQKLVKAGYKVGVCDPIE